MSAARSIPWKTKQDQWRASDPKLSAWVSAHAGSGKTHVLSQRVVRLLLARVPPSRILCLTYTKAAAANMAARIFDILAKWTLLDDDALDNAVEKASDIVENVSDIIRGDIAGGASSIVQHSIDIATHAVDRTKEVFTGSSDKVEEE